VTVVFIPQPLGVFVDLQWGKERPKAQSSGFLGKAKHYCLDHPVRALVSEWK
jgi:hypothetical protein